MLPVPLRLVGGKLSARGLCDCRPALRRRYSELAERVDRRRDSGPFDDRDCRTVVAYANRFGARRVAHTQLLSSFIRHENEHSHFPVESHAEEIGELMSTAFRRTGRSESSRVTEPPTAALGRPAQAFDCLRLAVGCRCGTDKRPASYDGQKSTHLSRSRTAALRQVLYPAVSYWPPCARRSCVTTHHTVYYFVFGVIKLIAPIGEISKGYPCSEDLFPHRVNACLSPRFFP